MKDISGWIDEDYRQARPGQLRGKSFGFRLVELRHREEREKRRKKEGESKGSGGLLEEGSHDERKQVGRAWYFLSLSLFFISLSLVPLPF
jgi:hypothetical protein